MRFVALNENNLNDRFQLISNQSNIILNSGWNLIALNFSNEDTGTDRNISLVAGWNLIGFSSNVSLVLANAKFTNSSGSNFTWSNAITNNKVQAYLAYLDTQETDNQTKYKYLSTISGLDATAFAENRGYWIYDANEPNSW